MTDPAKTTTCPYCGTSMLPRADGLGLVCPRHCAERLEEGEPAAKATTRKLTAQEERERLVAALNRAHDAVMVDLERANRIRLNWGWKPNNVLRP